MEHISREDFDKAVSHTIRIELADGSTLYYYVTAEAKKAFRNFLLNETISVYDKEFNWFYIPNDRIVFVNQSDIVRITFLFDIPHQGEPEYFDNFKVTEDIPEEEADFWEEETEEDEEDEADEQPTELDLPQLIIKHRRQLEDTEIVQNVTMKTEGFFGNISSYWDLSRDEFEGMALEHDGEEWHLLAMKYLQFQDDDGEENFMPLKNLSVIEVERSFVMTDEDLEQYLKGEPEE